MYNKITQRILKKIGNPDLIADLVNKTSMEELRSILLEVFQKKVDKIKPEWLLRDYEKNIYVKPSENKQTDYHRLNQKLISILPDEFEMLELSPMAPLGTSSVLGPVHQNNIVSTIRNGEVVSDATNVLALECARRRKLLLSKNPKSSDKIKLCTSQRQVRAQNFDDPNFTRHFSIFALCTAGRDDGNFQFEVDALSEHISFYLTLINDLIDPSCIDAVTLRFFKYSENGIDKLIDNLKEIVYYKFSESILVESSTSISSYYSLLRFMIRIKNKDKPAYDYIDGGFTDWTAKLLNNKKERLLISGIGTELLLKTLILR